ncbi:mmgE/PrpD family protein (plasmid) [Azospirillum sp. B510]|nr:mmgE/PrpD family protein [Azospirillum sp. B510]
MTPTSLTRRLAGFAAGLRLSDIPPDIVAKIRLHLLDTLGCGLAGAGTDLTRRMLAALRAECADGPCPVLGTGLSLAPAGAAFVNSVAMNALDHDDGFEVDGKGMGHPGATLVAAALSGIAVSGADGTALLAALAAAYEINARIILSIQPSYERFRQVYGVCQHQSLAAAAVYGRLLGFGADDLANAFGFAGTLAPLPSLRRYNWESRPLVSFKDFNAPAAEAGLRAVGYAKAGLVGATDVLDGPTGFWRMIGSDRFDPDILCDGLGEIWWTRHASFKPYPACRWMHTALESFETLRGAHGLAAGEIEAIEVLTSAGMARDFMDAAPRDMVDAQFSLPFCLACVALELPPVDWYGRDALADDARAALAARVTAIVDHGIDGVMSGEKRRPAGQVRVLARGRWFEGPRLSHPLGCRERPMDEAAVIAKFRSNAARSLPEPALNRLQANVLAIEAMSDATCLFPLIQAPGAADRARHRRGVDHRDHPDRHATDQAGGRLGRDDVADDVPAAETEGARRLDQSGKDDPS